MALQLGSKYFANVSGVDGVLGSFNVFKNSEKLAKNIDTINELLNNYWDYKNNPNLTDDQRFLLIAMKVTNALIGKELTVNISDVADTLANVIERQNEYNTAIALAEGIASGFSTINVIDNCLFGCKMKRFELTPIFTYIGGGYDNPYNLQLKDLKKTDITENDVGKTVYAKTDVESSLGNHDYEFSGLPMGLYMATVYYSNGGIYRQPVHIDKQAGSYIVNTYED